MVKKAAQGKNGTFGSTERRFAPKGGQAAIVVNENPGPGSYIQPDADAIKKEEIKRSSSMFISKTKRAGSTFHMTKKSKQQPGLDKICYDDSANTIAANVKRKVDQINNPLLAQLTTKNNTTLAFTTKAPRFNAKIMDEETYIGPGYYEQKSCFEKSRSTLATRGKTNAST